MLTLTIGSVSWILVGWRCNQMSRTIPKSLKSGQTLPRIDKWSSATASRSRRLEILSENSWWIFLLIRSAVYSFLDFKINCYNQLIINLKTWLTIKYIEPRKLSPVSWIKWDNLIDSREASILNICNLMFLNKSYCQPFKNIDYKIFLHSQPHTPHSAHPYITFIKLYFYLLAGIFD